jgi:probable F420-dependent oxidoreductase
VKVRIGLGAGAASAAAATGDGGAAAFGDLVDGLEARGFDSLWVSERATAPMLEPMAALAFAAGRTARLKLGTSVQVLPGRNPVLLAKAWASLDRLSGGRALPAFGLGVVDAAEQQAFGVARDERAGRFDEALTLMRMLWRDDTVDFDGAHFHYEAVSIGLRPAQDTIDVWLGGRAPGELRRVGRMSDGWLPSFCTPDQVADGRVVVEDAADAAGRAIDPEHFGALVAYARDAIPDAYAGERAQRLGIDPAAVVPVGLDALRTRLEEFVAVGFSKLVVVPAEPVRSWDRELDDLVEAVLDLQGSR